MKEPCKLTIIETHWDLDQRISTRRVRRVKRRVTREGIGVRPSRRSRRTKR